MLESVTPRLENIDSVQCLDCMLEGIRSIPAVNNEASEASLVVQGQRVFVLQPAIDQSDDFSC